MYRPCNTYVWLIFQKSEHFSSFCRLMLVKSLLSAWTSLIFPVLFSHFVRLFRVYLFFHCSDFRSVFLPGGWVFPMISCISFIFWSISSNFYKKWIRMLLGEKNKFYCCSLFPIFVFFVHFFIFWLSVSSFFRCQGSRNQV